VVEWGQSRRLLSSPKALPVSPPLGRASCVIEIEHEINTADFNHADSSVGGAGNFQPCDPGPG
jgi:hypothetical protein